MKKLFVLSVGILLSLLTFGQGDVRGDGSPQIEGYEIIGRISGEYRGKVYLVKEDGLHGPQTKIDSCEVKEGKFFFKGKEPQYSVIYFIQSQDGQLAPVFLENGRIHMKIRADYFLGADAAGTVNNNLWGLHQLQTGFVKDSMLKATVTDWLRFGRKDSEFESREFDRRTKLGNSRKMDIEKQMVKYYNNEAFAPFIILFEMVSELSLDELKALRAQLDPKLNDHPYTRTLDETINNMAFKPGIEAPAFSIPGIDGKEIELKNYKGKYVLLDFWASWCGPCRREMPNVVKLYKVCKGKDFEIIGISLDQKAEDWKKAVKELGMKWPQGCDFGVWNGQVARKYNVRAVPTTILINPEGKVEAIDLRGEQLAKTIKTLLKAK